MTAHVIAHRGFHRDELENSVAAVRAAEGAGATMVEIDVQEARDGELVVLHDTEVDGVAMAALGLDELRSRLPPGAAPRFRDVLDATGLPLDVEIKRADPAKVVGEIRRSGRSGCVITSFDARTVAASKEAAPELRCGLLVSERDYGALADAELPRTLLGAAADARADFVGLQTGLARAAVLAALATSLAPSFIWVVNDGALLRRFAADPAVGGVVTDRPELAQQP